MMGDRKGKGRAIDAEPTQPSLPSVCERLPFEIQQQILGHLCPADLAQVAATNRNLRLSAVSDALWRRHVADVVAASPPPRAPWIQPYRAPPAPWQTTFNAPEAPPWPFPTQHHEAEFMSRQREGEEEAAQDLPPPLAYASSASTSTMRSSIDAVTTPLHPDRTHYNAIRQGDPSRNRLTLDMFPGAHSFYEVYIYFLQPLAHLLGWWASDAPNHGGIMRFILDLEDDEPIAAVSSSSSGGTPAIKASKGPAFVAQRLHFTNRLAGLDTRARHNVAAVRVPSANQVRLGPQATAPPRPEQVTTESNMWNAITSFPMPVDASLGPPTILRYDSPNASFNVDVLDPGVRTERWISITWADVRDRLRAEQERDYKHRSQAQAHDRQRVKGMATRSAVRRSTMRCWPVHPVERIKHRDHTRTRTAEAKRAPTSGHSRSGLSVEEREELELSDESDDALEPFDAWTMDRLPRSRSPSPPMSPVPMQDVQEDVFAFDAHRPAPAGGTSSQRQSSTGSQGRHTYDEEAPAAPTASAHPATGAVAAASADGPPAPSEPSASHPAVHSSSSSSASESSVSTTGSGSSGLRPTSVEEAHALAQQERAAALSAFGAPWAPMRSLTRVNTRSRAQGEGEGVGSETYEHILYRATMAISTGLQGALDASRVVLRTQRGKRPYARAARRHLPFALAAGSGYAQAAIHAAGPGFGFGFGFGVLGLRGAEVEPEPMPAALFPPPGLLHIVRAGVPRAGRGAASVMPSQGGGEAETVPTAFGAWERDGEELELDRLQMVPSPPYVCFPHPRLGARPMRSGPRWYPLIGPPRLPPWEQGRDDEHKSGTAMSRRLDNWNENIPPSLDPASPDFEWDSLAGLYAQTYGPHGIELVYVRSRILTAADFASDNVGDAGGQAGEGRGPRRWVPEPLLSSDDMFDDVFMGQSIDRSAVRPGARVVEAIKVTGDPNVPRGQVTWRAFVSDPDVRRIPWRAPKPGFRNHPPWPFVEATSRGGSTRTSADTGLGATAVAGAGLVDGDVGAEDGGLDHPGLVAGAHGRVAGEGFAGAAWARAMVLIAPHEIRVWWQPMMKFAVARKLYGM